MKTLITTEKKVIFFNKKYYIIQSNNGNHTGLNRKWILNADGYNTKKEANKVKKEMISENGNIKYGLTHLKIITADELIDIYSYPSKNGFVSFLNCFDIKIDENK